MPKPITITPEQEKYILDNYLLKSTRKLAEDLPVSRTVIIKYLRKNNLKIPKHVAIKFRVEGMKGKTTFTKSDDDFVRANYLTMPIKHLADKIGRSYTGVMGALKRMNLELPQEIIDRNRKSAQIKPGTTPPNKGKKQTDYMSPETIERTKATRFKKGQIPASAKGVKDGDIRPRNDRRTGRTYLYIRLALGRWRKLHRHIWEQANGKIPKGHCLRFINGNTSDVRLDNLELITFKENRLRNSGSVNLTDSYVAATMSVRNPELKEEILTNHPELIEIKRASLQLNRTINEKS